MLLFVPGSADAWIDVLFEYEEDGLIEETEMWAALEYMQSLGFLAHNQTGHDMHPRQGDPDCGT